MESTPIESISFGFGVVQWIVTVAIGIYAWIIGRQSASQKEMMELRARIIKLESDYQQVPTNAALSEVLARLERLDAHVQATAETLKPINKQLDRINDYLLNNK